MNIDGFLGECNKAEHFCIKYVKMLTIYSNVHKSNGLFLKLDFTVISNK